MCYCPHFIDETQRGEAVLPNVTQLLNKKAEPYDSELKLYNVFSNLPSLRPVKNCFDWGKKHVRDMLYHRSLELFHLA